MTDKQKQAIRILNSMHERKFADDEEYFLLLDFIVGQPQVTYIPWTTEPKPIIYETDDNFVHKSTPFDPQRNYEPDGIFGSPTAIDSPNDCLMAEPTMQGGSASSGLDPIRLDELRKMPGGCESITDRIKAKENEMSYGDRLIKEGRSLL